ncbi:hypothetical protein [Oceanobacillus chungangensis]|uniref:Uncharacterized protein n=1 Tax=Oceanobacillus chungangensis TaxID=1229152 RepID=A0A3D8PJK8_9BACI|nr:hypothetical protein [Oceanobacillus chungangensis]RDW15375.1 hypothetical protein CWR45_16435 [Oceanobacillus chungangensis]
MVLNNKDKNKQTELERERISVQAKLGRNSLLDIDHKASGDSVNEHRTLESANASIAEDIIKQTFNNS